MGIYVWGTGCGAAELLAQGLAADRIAAFVDTYRAGQTFLGRPVWEPERLRGEAVSLLIVTSRASEEIGAQCRALGIPEQRILFLKNAAWVVNRNDVCTAAEPVLGAELLGRLLPRQYLVTEPAALADSPLAGERESNDYVRLASLELLCRWLDAVPGAAAELGVFRGQFARCINQLLPERELHLFDSFSGFAPGECGDAAFQEAHCAATPEQVREILPHPQAARFHPGFFPASAQGVEARFCLVSLDVDFGPSTLAGLRWFWPRMNSGGYLLLHDWGNPRLPGPAQALAAFEKEWGRPLPGVPLPDLGGTLVLCRQG